MPPAWWRGHWTQQLPGRPLNRQEMNLNMSVTGTVVSGGGSDELGDFRLSGLVDSRNMRIVKEFFGPQPPHPNGLRRAEVAIYTGTSTNGRQYTGNTFLQDVPMHLDHGAFAITAPDGFVPEAAPPAPPAPAPAPRREFMDCLFGCGKRVFNDDMGRHNPDGVCRPDVGAVPDGYDHPSEPAAEPAAAADDLIVAVGVHAGELAGEFYQAPGVVELPPVDTWAARASGSAAVPITPPVTAAAAVAASPPVVSGDQREGPLCFRVDMTASMTVHALRRR